MRGIAATFAVLSLFLTGLAAPVGAAQVTCLGETATIVGTAGPDRLEGTPGRDVIHGRGGDDEISGLDEDDVLCGGAGDDVLMGGRGDDVLSGGGGDDLLRGGPGADDLRSGPGNDEARGQGQSDLVVGGPGADLLRGGPGADVMLGNGGRDDLAAGSAPDVLSGGRGEDRLAGGGGDDVLAGGPDGDRMRGGKGFDVLVGGRGTDAGAGGGGTDFCSGLRHLSLCETIDPDLSDWLRSSPARDFAERIRDVLVFQEGCLDRAELEGAAVRASAFPPGDRDHLVGAVADLSAAAGFCEGDGNAWSQPMVDALGHLEDFVSLITGAPSPAEPPRSEPGAVATRAIEVYETLRGHLQGGVTPWIQSDLWWDRRTPGHSRNLAVAAAAGMRFDVVFVGSSTVLSGADPVVFAEEDGRAAYNAGLPGSGPEIQAAWVEQRLLALQPELVVVGIEPHSFRKRETVPGSCADSLVPWTQAADRRALAFSPVTALAEASEAALFFGDPPAVIPGRPVPHDTFFDSIYSDLGHRTVPLPGLSDEEKELRASQSREEWGAGYEPCDERIDVLTDTIAALTANGIAVVVVGMPLSDIGAGILTDSRVTVAALFDHLEPRVVAAGAGALVDLSSAIDDDRFPDLHHVDENGARRFTRLLAAALEDLGL